MRAAGWSGSAALEILCDDRLSLLLGSRQRAFERLAACGPWALSLLAVGARVKFSKNRFALDDDGEAALIVEGLDEFGDLVDCVAIALDGGQVASHSGAIWALGLPSVYPSFGEPIDVHRTAWDWLTANGRGLFVLDWHTARHWRVATGLELCGVDRAHAAEIKGRLEIPPARVFYPAETQQVAA